MLSVSVYLIILFHWIVVSLSSFCLSYPLTLPLSSCLGCIPQLIGLHLLRSLLRNVSCGSLLFVTYVRAFVQCFCFLLVAYCYFVSSVSLPVWRRCPLLATFLSIVLSLFSLLFFLRTCSRFDLVWFRLSCDHGWIRSGSVNNVR